jgi:hypothetical protein
MNLVIDQLKGVLSDSIAKFLKENIKLEDTDIKTIFGDNMDKVLYHDEGFLKDLSSKMSDVVMPAYMKELRYLKKIVSGVDDVTKSMKTLQDRLAKDLGEIVPNPQNANESKDKINKIVEEFVKKATELTQTKIGLREVLQEEETKSGEEAKTEVLPEEKSLPVEKSSSVSNAPPLEKAAVIKPIANAVLSTPSDITNALSDEIANIINQKKTQRGGARMPDIEPKINEYIETHEKVPRIPKRNYTEYDGNISQLLNQIIREKMVNYEETPTVLSDEIVNSKSYKDVVGSINELFILKPEMQTAAINQLVQTIKESKISDKALQKIMDNAAKQIKMVKGGTRKKR